MKFLIPVFLIGPFVLAWAIMGAMCQGWFPTADACPGPGERGSVYMSFLIMFAIAFWVGGGLTYALLRMRGVEGPDEDDRS